MTLFDGKEALVSKQYIFFRELPEWPRTLQIPNAWKGKRKRFEYLWDRLPDKPGYTYFVFDHEGNWLTWPVGDYVVIVYEPREIYVVGQEELDRRTVV